MNGRLVHFVLLLLVSATGYLSLLVTFCVQYFILPVVDVSFVFVDWTFDIAADVEVGTHILRGLCRVAEIATAKSSVTPSPYMRDPRTPLVNTYSTTRHPLAIRRLTQSSVAASHKYSSMPHVPPPSIALRSVHSATMPIKLRSSKSVPLAVGRCNRFYWCNNVHTQLPTNRASAESRSRRQRR